MEYDVYIYEYISSEKFCFVVDFGMEDCDTSKAIADLFKMSVDNYNEILINKVIKHDKYRVETFTDMYKVSYVRDVTFVLNGTLESVYVNRFKEAFAPQLTLLTLGGIEDGN